MKTALKELERRRKISKTMKLLRATTLPPHNKGMKGYRNGGTFWKGMPPTAGCFKKGCVSRNKGVRCRDEIRVQISNTLKRKYANGELESQSPKAFWKCYRGINFRSSWEVAFAKWLDSIKEPWQYEPVRFILKGVGSYTPDFYLPKQLMYVEVKGITRSYKWGDRLKAFVAQFWKETLIVLEKNALDKLGIVKLNGELFGGVL